ncbi:ATP-binding cassette domain-containing protein [Streptomyces sp. DASNCL29]|nr:ATP-binding cassette domain-containing protein [Streptomyces sp. DASNCL29]
MTETQEPRAVVALTDVAVHRRTTGQEIVLDGINWTVRPGEHWALLGANGAGKTTLLRLVGAGAPFMWPVTTAGGTHVRAARRTCGTGTPAALELVGNAAAGSGTRDAFHTTCTICGVSDVPLLGGAVRYRRVCAPAPRRRPPPDDLHLPVSAAGRGDRQRTCPMTTGPRWRSGSWGPTLPGVRSHSPRRCGGLLGAVAGHRTRRRTRPAAH